MKSDRAAVLVVFQDPEISCFEGVTCPDLLPLPPEFRTQSLQILLRPILIAVAELETNDAKAGTQY